MHEPGYEESWRSTRLFSIFNMSSRILKGLFLTFYNFMLSVVVPNPFKPTMEVNMQTMGLKK